MGPSPGRTRALAPSRRPGGNWTDGFETTGYFLDWLTERYPDAVYRLNKSLDPQGRNYWDERAFEYITGQTLPELWNAYQEIILEVRGSHVNPRQATPQSLP